MYSADCKLIVAAANAASIKGAWTRKATPARHAKNPSDCVEGFFVANPRGGYGKLWNPLADDGDALRLAVKLGLIVDAAAHRASDGMGSWSAQAGERDGYAATRRAIVRAAAAMAA